ncbi:MAG TPA: glycoside hydrolase family 97 N-terminal domain-containing protein [Duganella sp.]|uniref:glycoside hydrolase family 97 N-terminal domain-containing protein n=1 Tax=Duganella sp. TaxID=1904440 RepID=UPI002ED5B51A
MVNKFIFAVAVGATAASTAIAATPGALTSPGPHISVQLNESPGKPLTYTVSRDGRPVLLASDLGLQLQGADLIQERTSFALPASAKAWLQPIAVAQTGWGRTNPSYEEHYQMDIPVGTAPPSPAGWVFPALFKAGDNWLAISEAGMDGSFQASRLVADSKF